MSAAVYVVIRKGVYRHEVIGVFSNVDRAKDAAHESVQAEHDHYHDAQILLCNLDGGGERRLGEVEAIWEGLPRVYKGTRWTGVAS